MFKDTKEGETHSYNDGCGEPAHNHKLPKEIEERFDKELNWKDCGNFKFEDYTIRPCVICGVDTRFCVNCSRDHHLGNRDVAIKSFIATILEMERGRVVKKIEKMMNEYRMRECPIKGRMSQCTKDMCFHWTPSWENIINLIKEDK